MKAISFIKDPLGIIKDIQRGIKFSFMKEEPKEVKCPPDSGYNLPRNVIYLSEYKR